MERAISAHREQRESALRSPGASPPQRSADKPRAGPADRADPDPDGISSTGRFEYVARLHDTIFAPPVKKADGDGAVKREPRVTRELVIPLPDSHPLAAAPPGWARVRLRRAGKDDEHFEGPLTRDEAASGESSGEPRPRIIRVALGPAHGLAVTHRQTTHTQSRGTITRHNLKLSNGGERDVSVRVVAPIAQARTGEVLNARPSPTRTGQDALEFVVKVTAGEEQKVSYSLFYAQ